MNSRRATAGVSKGGRVVFTASRLTRAPLTLKEGVALCFEARFLFRQDRLFRALINPRADQADLLGGQRFGRRPESARATARSARFRLGRHAEFVINPGHGNHQQTFFAVTGYHHFAVFTAFEHGLKVVEAQFAFLLFFAVAAEARGPKQRTNVFGVGDTLFGGSQWKFAEIEFVDVDLFLGGYG